MDKFLKSNLQKHVDKTLNALKNNNMEAYYVSTKEEASDLTAKLLNDGDTVAVGGSVTLSETGILDLLRSGKYNFLDRYEKGLSRCEIDKIFHESFCADAYLTSSNAITEEGELYNVDGNGNRVAAMIYGPKNVIVVAGTNKIVKDRDAAIERVKSIAAPANAERLSCKTPCAITGECMNCKGDARICCSYVFLGQQRVKNRIKVILVGEDLGY